MIFTQLHFEEIDVGLICGLLYFLRMHSNIKRSRAAVLLIFSYSLNIAMLLRRWYYSVLQF